MALVGRSAPQTGTELETLLRRRFKGLFFIGLGASLVLAGASVPLNIKHPDWHLLTIFAALVLTAAFGTTLLLCGRPKTLRGLRLLEALGIGVMAACLAWHTSYHAGHRTAAFYSELSDHWYDFTLIERAKETGRDTPETIRLFTALFPMHFMAAFFNLLWFGLIMAYGIFIPNTWRRCLVGVGLLVLTGLVVQGLFILTDDGVRSWMAAVYMWATGTWLAIGASLAIYGSHRIETLRQEAAKARRLGQYQLKEIIGSGGMGDVYLAEHTLLRRPCAIKIIRPERAGDPKNLLRFEREVQATATLTNWNTVEIFDYGRATDGTFYYVMEYLPGLNLEQLVRTHGPLPPERAIHFLRQVCASLREAHAIGLIHRDVKPSNIIACPRGGLFDVAKLLDFGLVIGPEAGSQKLTQEGALTGTPAYMSPEQAAGLDELDATSDIYSLGAVAYFLLTGQPPFVKKTSVQVLAAHLHERPPGLRDVRSEVPEDLEGVVLRCLEKEKTRRFADSESLEQALSVCQCSATWTTDCARAWWQSRQAEK
jgi:serine/threonine-protein kinase